MKIHQGQIWEVTAEDFYGNIDIPNQRRTLCCYLKPGEKIEIRFPFEWNYRTEDNIYLYSSEEYILQKCKLIGTVNEKIKWENKASLEEILRLGLYEKSPEIK